MEIHTISIVFQGQVGLLRFRQDWQSFSVVFGDETLSPRAWAKKHSLDTDWTDALRCPDGTNVTEWADRMKPGRSRGRVSSGVTSRTCNRFVAHTHTTAHIL